MVPARRRAPTWIRATARSVLMTFTTSLLACGGSPTEAPATTTMPLLEQTAATMPPEPPPPPPQQQAAPPPTLPAQAPDQLSKEELRDLVAPVALYPDVVLASLLPATTFPDQLRDAAQYVGQSQQVESVPPERGWDGSIVGLLQFPDVLRWLDGNPAWTDEMGQAVTYQQADVLQAIQDYRRMVSQAGNLKSNQYQKVRTASNQDILIEPARPDIVYVPSYDPVVATQPQPVVVQESPGINPWIAFGGGAVVGALGAWALYSIFDDDDDYDDHYYRRRIRGYDNYYYYRGRRPRWNAWNPRPRPWRRVENWQRPQRLRYVSTAPPPRRRAALRPPMTATAVQAPTPAQVRKQQQRENRQQRQLQQQQNRQFQQEQRRDRQQAQQEQRQQKKQAQQMEQQQRQDRRQQQRQQQRDQQQQRKQERQQAEQQQQDQRRQQRQQNQQQRQERQQQQQQQRQEQRRQQQERQQQQQQQRQEQRQQQQQRQQEQKQQRQEQRQENRQERQEQRQERKEQRQQNQGGGGGGGNKKKQQN